GILLRLRMILFSGPQEGSRWGSPADSLEDHPMSFARSALLACTALVILPATALAADADDQQRDAESRIVVTGARATSASATKTDTPAIEVPQPVTVIPAELFEA